MHMLTRIAVIFILSVFGLTNAGITDIKHLFFARNLDELKKKYFLSTPSDSFNEDAELLAHQALELFKTSSQHNTSSCTEDIAITAEDLLKKTPYAMKMLDSWGKPESGVLRGNVLWEGRYFECRSAVNTKQNFSGNACLLIFGNPPPQLLAYTLRMEICIPNTCTDKDIKEYIEHYVNTTVTVSCPPEPHQWDALAVTGIVIIALLACLVALATIYDLYTKHQDNSELQYHAVSEVTQDKVEDEPIIAKCLQSFSVRLNTINFLNTEKRKGNIHCLHGLRFLSITWVVLGHTILMLFTYVDNITDTGNLVSNRLSFMAINSGTFSVDSFFFLSGLLVAYLGLREMSRNDGKISIWKMYLIRYIRLTPAYAFLVLFVVSLYGVIGQGPGFSANVEAIKNPCIKYWWTNFLYINNLYPINLGDECVNWSWYLANDMQFYLISPLFLILLYRKPKIGIASLVLGTTISIAITGALSNYYGLQPVTLTFGLIGHVIVQEPPPPQIYIPKGNATASQADILASDIYAKPWCRVGVYFIGMLTGYILHVTKGNIKMKKPTVALGWILTVIMQLALVYGLYGHIHGNEYLSLNVAAFYNAVSRPLWAVGLAWVVIACVSGYGGLVNRFLSWSVFIPLSRLSYCLYLFHILVIGLLLCTQETSIHYSMTLLIVYFLAIMVLGNGCAYVVSMLVEAPMLGIQKALLRKETRTTNNNSDTTQLINESQ